MAKVKPSKIDIQKRIVSLISSDNLVINGTDLVKRLNLKSAASLSYYTKDLFVHGILNKDNHFWVVDTDKAFSYFDNIPDSVTKSASCDTKFKSRTCRSHGYGLKVSLSKSIDGEKLGKHLGLSKGVKDSREHFWSDNSNRYNVYFFFNNWKLCIYKSSISFWMSPDVSYFGAKAATNDLHILYDFVNTVIKPLEKVLGYSFMDKSKGYEITPHSRHKARIKHSFAKMTQDEKKVFKVSVDGKVRLIVDDSFKNGEFEAISADFCIDDDEKTNGFFNGMLGMKEIFNPSDIVQMIAKNSMDIGKVNSHLEYHAENMRSHVSAIQKLGDGVDKLTSIVSSDFSGVAVSNKEKGTINLEMVKSLINSIGDVILNKELINGLSDVDKSLFSLWLFEKFNEVKV